MSVRARRSGPIGLALGGAIAACSAERPVEVPGETDIEIERVVLEGKDGAELTPDEGPLLEGLGMREAGLILPGRHYGVFREAEDRRRIEAYFQNYGFFDVEVDEPEVEFLDDGERAEIRWVIEENARYRIESVHLESAPEGHEETLRAMIPFEVGTDAIDLEEFRRARMDMHDHLRAEGFGHATVYSRAFVDRDEERLHWYYYVDAGPKTRVGEVSVSGNERVPSSAIEERVGLETGDAYAEDDVRRREFDLLDAGAFASAFIDTTADTEFIPPGEAPDTGGEMRSEQIGEDGAFLPRDLPEEVDLEINVVEAPRRQFRARAGAEADPARIDAAASARARFRDVFGPLHHLVLEGRLGYGWHWRGDADEPTGVYGDALARYVRPMALSRLTDFRLTGRARDELFPGFHLREVTAGPGLRRTLGPALFADVDALFRFGQQVGFGPFDDGVRSEHNLPDEDAYVGGELRASLIWDERDNPVEALEGHYLSLRASASPGGGGRWNRYLTLEPEARWFLPIAASFSVGLRGDAGWAFAEDERGLPLGPRLFGGGAHGMRGFGRNRLSPYAACAGEGADCEELPVGGKSLAQASIEGRFLPEMTPYGAVVFADVGGAGRTVNPFDEGVSAAVGVGLRLRLWFLPASVDAGYRVLREGALQGFGDDPFQLFFRIGEAF